MLTRRTDLAEEAHALCLSGKARSLPGVRRRRRLRAGVPVTEVTVCDERAAQALEKPVGRYVTLDLACRTGGEEAAARAVGAELRRLMGDDVRSALVVGLGNAAMTPDAVGSATAGHILVTRHLHPSPLFAALAAVSVIVPGVLGKTGFEAAELVRGAVRQARPDAVIAVDALSARSLSRLCTSVQLSDTGIVPGSGVGNHRAALTRESLGVPVYAVGVPTVVDAATLTLDVLEEAGGASLPDPAALRGHTGVFVTTRDIDAEIALLARVMGYGINLALQPLDLAELRALLA